MNQKNPMTDEYIITISKIIVLVGIFFLILAFGHIMPALLSHKNREKKHDENEIFDEINMINKLKKHILNDEILIAGIHAISNEISITSVFEKCICTKNSLIPNEDGSTIALNKKKYSTSDIYIGVTDSSLIITDCDKSSYYYEFDDKPNINIIDVQNIESEISFNDIGVHFSLKDIQSYKIKNGWMGSIQCFIKMKNGSYFKLILPKFGGLGGGMPNHTRYREIILEKIINSSKSSVL